MHLKRHASEIDLLKQELLRLHKRIETLEANSNSNAKGSSEPTNQMKEPTDAAETQNQSTAVNLSESSGSAEKTSNPTNIPHGPLPSRPTYIPKPVSTTTPPPPTSPEIPPKPSGLQFALGKVIDYFTHGNTLAKIGVVILMIGLIFLAQLAISRGYFPIQLRLILIAIGGLVLLGLGFRLKDSRSNYALTLQGGGVGILYLSTFTAFRLYGLLPSSLTFILLFSIGVLATLLAVNQNAQHLAALGITGGFLAPMFSISDANHIAQFSYYLFLNLAVFMVAWFKSWRPLNLISFYFTIVLGSLWGTLKYRPEHFASSEPFF